MKIEPDRILIEEYNYALPADRIALEPLALRDASKLLMYGNGNINDSRFDMLPTHLETHDLLILNDTKVIEARLFFQKPSGGRIEIFCLEPADEIMELALQQHTAVRWKCLVGGASKWKAGQVLKKLLDVEGKTAVLTATYEDRVADSFIIRFAWEPADLSFIEVIHAAGAIPLPPYIKRKAEARDADRYQTIFGIQDGSVAAPTAALHFTQKVFHQLEQNGIEKEFITLNVGAGTFQPVKASAIADHQMHGEFFTISKKTLQRIIDNKRIIAVGTTSLRTIESIHWMGVKLLTGLLNDKWELGQWEVYTLDSTIGYKDSLQAVINYMEKKGVSELYCRTSLLIIPGYEFKIPCGLITNFHQPQSTLLLLVAAFIGDDWKKVYRYALDNDYRFLSYGDSSLLWRK